MFVLLCALVWFGVGEVLRETKIEHTAEASLARMATTTTPRQALEMLIREEFGANSPMLRVAYCESGLRHFYLNSNAVVRSHTNDFGVFQINYPTWGKTAQNMGIDIMSPSGNIQFARYILDKQGISAWNSSMGCWNA